MINIFYDDKNKRHFRGKYTKVKNETVIHSHYIVGEDEKNFASIGVTHTSETKSKTGKIKSNHLLNSNVNPNAKPGEKSYMKKRVEIGNKRLYSGYKNKYSTYRVSDEDVSYVDYVVDKKKNKK